MITAANVGPLNQTYTAAQMAAGGSAAALGLVAGMIWQVPNKNKFVQLVQCYASAGAALKDGAILKIVNATADPPIVDMTSATGDNIYAVNDNVGGTVAAGLYFWATISGPVSYLADTTAVAGSFVAGEATTGTGTVIAAWAATNRNNLLALVSGSGSAAKKAGVLFGGL